MKFNLNNKLRVSKLNYAHNPMFIVIIGFIFIILLGTFFLMLPISNRSGEWMNPLSALFTATSATCVTGLTVIDTHSTFTFFGELIILLLIQVGGLGFMSLAMILMMTFRKKFSFRERFLLSSSLGLDQPGGVLSFVRLSVIGTLIIEGIGAILLSFFFIPQHGILRGIWLSVFHAISSFCNAGFDILGSGDSLAALKSNGYILSILMILTIIGGLGFWVWKDLLDYRKKQRLSLYSKMVLWTTGSLLVFGTIFYLVAEWNNPQTIGNLSVGDKILNSLFCSVTMRTVGFSTFDIGSLTEPSKLISTFLMLIGGSSGSTAGGIKTVTFLLVVVCAYLTACGRNKVHLHGKTISGNDINRAFSLFSIAVGTILTSTILGCFLDPDAHLLDLLINYTSAFATVGVAGYTISAMSVFGKILLIALMFMGRIGVLTITLAIMVRLNRDQDKITYPKANIFIG